MCVCVWVCFIECKWAHTTYRQPNNLYTPPGWDGPSLTRRHLSLLKCCSRTEELIFSVGLKSEEMHHGKLRLVTGEHLVAERRRWTTQRQLFGSKRINSQPLISPLNLPVCIWVKVWSRCELWWEAAMNQKTKRWPKIKQSLHSWHLADAFFFPERLQKFIRTFIHTPTAVAANARCRQAHQEQLGVQYLYQGHFQHADQRNWTSNPPITRRWFYPWAITASVLLNSGIHFTQFKQIEVWNIYQ